MLVLTRRVGQAVQIGSDVRISVVEIRNGQVRLAIDAPQSIRIIRSEVETQENGAPPDENPES